jgi:uncharacterized membrane protein
MLFFLSIVAFVWLGLRVRRSIREIDAAVKDLKARVVALEVQLRRDATSAPASVTSEVRLKPDATDVRPEIKLKPDATHTLRPDTAPASRPDVTAPPAVAPIPMSSGFSRIPPATPPSAPSEAEDSFEARIGSRWLLYVGVIAIVVGVSYFEKLAIENQWIGETARVLQGAAAGALLVYLGLRFVRAGYQLYGQILSGCGVAILYVSTYAAFNFYHLIGQPLAFTVMFLITLFGAWLADRQRSQGLALMAVGGGFATPFLLSSGVDAQIALFGYDSILVAGTMLLAHRREWPALNILSYGFTVFTVAAWAGRFYSASQYLTTELFLTLYCAMYLYILREGRRRTKDAFAQLAELVLFTAPFLYYLASLAILWRHSPVFLVYLMALTLAGAGYARSRGAGVRLIFWIAAVVPLFSWILVHSNAQWLLPGLAVVGGVYAIHLIAHFDATLGADRRLTGGEIAALHLNGLVTYGATYLLVDAVNSAATAPIAAGFAFWHLAIAFALAERQREHALHFAALAFTLLVIAIGLQFDGAWAIAAWAAEGAAVIVLGLRERREWLRAGGLLLFLFAIDQMLELLDAAPRAGQLVLLNRRALSAAFVIALTYGLAWIHGRQPDSGTRRIETGIALVTAKLLLLALITSEINAFWAVRGAADAWSMGHESLDTITWAAVGSTLVWLGIARRQSWIRGIGFAVIAVAVLRLVRLDLADASQSYVILFNARLIASMFVIALLYGIAFLYRHQSEPLDPAVPLRTVLLIAANALTLLLLTSEITAYWRVRAFSPAAAGVAASTSDFAREMMLSVTWAIYATGLIIAGLKKQYAPIRYFAIALFVITIVKVFMIDLAELDQIYRVASIVGLGVMLLMTSYLYHRFRGRVV